MPRRVGVVLVWCTVILITLLCVLSYSHQLGHQQVCEDDWKGVYIIICKIAL